MCSKYGSSCLDHKSCHNHSKKVIVDKSDTFVMGTLLSDKPVVELSSYGSLGGILATTVPLTPGVLSCVVLI